MRKFEEIESKKERDEIVLLLSNWLENYTHDVIVRVLEKRDEIINNVFAMNLLRELKEREEEEHVDFIRSIDCYLVNYDGFKEFNPHNHPLSHSQSYRDILHDMYIKQ